MLTQLGPYLIDEELAEGGMARVFRARLRGLGGFEKQLVIKQIRPELARDPKFVELFVREANTLVALSHPHIVQVYELGAAEGTYYLSMEYVEGATIASMLEEGPLSPALTAHLGAQICEALDYAHSRFGILHRDITPRNIIVDHAGHGRLLDFGIAIHETGPGERVLGGELFGSPGYMSPEHAAGQALGPESDLFALGAVLFECLSGAPAFAKTPRASLTDAPDLSRLSGQPTPLVRLITSLLSRSPDERPDARAAARGLREFLAQTRPEGVLHEMQARAVRAEQAQRTKRERAAHARRQGEDRAAARPETATARVETQSIATSLVLTEIMRSSGLAPMPQPPGHAQHAEASPEEPGTRRIRERERAQDAPETATGPRRSEREREKAGSHSPALTRWMLRTWPTLALLAMAIALLMAYRRGALEAPPTPPSQVRAAQALDHHPTRATAAAEHGPKARQLAPEDAQPDGHQAEPPAAAGLASDARADVGARDVLARASLSVNALPWANVSIDGKAQGTTPLRKLKLRPGVHRVELNCPPLGQRHVVAVELSPKGDARLVVDLQQEPPRTFLDGAIEVR